jgi:ribonuclease R
MTDRELLRHIERSPGQRAGYKQLVREFGLGGGRERRLLVEHLARLTASGQLTKVDREQWTIARAAATRDNLVAGRLDLHRDGFGFVRVTGRRPGRGEPRAAAAGGAAADTGDIFIPPTEMNGAMQGDQVLVEVAPPRADGKASGRILRVLTRRNPTIVGVFHYAQSDRQQGHHVVPFDEKMTQPILIPYAEPLPPPVASVSPHRVLGEQAAAATFPDLEGLVVDVEVTEWPTPNRVARGRVVEVLGDPDGFGVDVEMVIRKHQLQRIFPANVLDEASVAAHLDETALAGRRDFRDEPIVTIDGETARDFDDAVLVRELADGSWELEVHIADVAEYVQPATALDLEARLRGNSVYFPDRAIPMLPHELSSGICSLRPDEDRLVLSCLMQVDAQGDVTGYEVVEGVIRSARRMTYTQVAAILGDEETQPDEALRVEFAPLVGEFEKMKRLAQVLYAKREQRGSIDFDLPEPIIEFDEWGAMKSVTRSTRNWAHRLIEEFMLAANESVASWLEPLSPSLYRIHEKPDPRRILEFEDTAATFGYSLGIGNLPVKRFAMKNDRRDAQRSNDRGGKRSTNTRAIEIPEDIPVTPRMYQKLALKIAGKPEERILSYLMLRSLKQARYSEENEGHFALASPCYTHFTSPIRRYPDLVVHRIAKRLLREGISGRGTLAPGEPHSAKAGPTPRTATSQATGSTPLGQQKRSRVQASQRASGENIPGLLRFGEESATVAHALQVSASEGKNLSYVPRGTIAEAVIPESELAAIAHESSENERRAAAAERELVEWKKIKFMRDKVGDEFDGMIMSATKYGLFVELAELFVEGLVPLGSLGALDGDYYIYHETTREIIGEHWGRKFRMGQRVRVLLEKVDAVEKRLQFSIVLSAEEASTESRFPKLGQKKPAKPKKEKKRKSMQASTPKHRIPAPKAAGKEPKRKR